MTTITLTETKYSKNPNTKTTYTETSKKTDLIEDRKHYNLTNDDTCKWFRRLGGSETKTMAYTCAGYKCVKLTSVSPDKQSKTVREFAFKFIQ